MANDAVQGQPVVNPWLTWSTPEFGEGFWPLPPDEDPSAMALAEQAIPDLVGYPGTHDAPAPSSYQSTGYGGVGYGGVGDDDDDVIEVVEDVWEGPPAAAEMGYYGPSTSWGATSPTFAQTMGGWGMLVYDEGHQRHRPPLRLGYSAFWVGVVGGALWGFSGRNY